MGTVTLQVMAEVDVKSIDRRSNSRDLSPTRVLLGPADVEANLRLLRLATWAQDWSELMQGLLSRWSSWELPVPRSRNFWSAPKFEPEIEGLRHSHQGFAPYLLSLFATFPGQGRACAIISKQLAHFQLWDLWLKQHGTPREIEETESFFGNFARTQGAGESSSSSSSALPRRLDSKYPGRSAAFVEEVNELKALTGESRWLEGYFESWHLYAKEGLAMHGRIAKMCQSGQTPAMDEFLVYKSAASGAKLLLFLAAANLGLEELGSEVSDQALRLVSVASMLMAVYGDVYLALRRKQHTSVTISLVDVYDLEQAHLVHNCLVECFTSEREDLLARVRGNQIFSQEAACIEKFVTAIQASMHGAMTWFEFPSRFQAPQGQLLPLRSNGQVLATTPAWVAAQIDAAVEKDMALTSLRQHGGAS